VLQRDTNILLYEVLRRVFTSCGIYIISTVPQEAFKHQESIILCELKAQEKSQRTDSRYSSLMIVCSSPSTEHSYIINEQADSSRKVPFKRNPVRVWNGSLTRGFLQYLLTNYQKESSTIPYQRQAAYAE
jgi:hypothetical protein